MTTAQEEKLQNFSVNYLKLLNTAFKGLNLTRILEPNEFYLKQVLDSVIPLKNSKSFQKAMDESSLIVDVGFGGGFPILPLAVIYPEKKFVGLEARRKKADAVNEIARSMGLDNVHCFHERIENVNLDLDCVVTFKAVGKASDFLKKIKSSKDICAYFYKGKEVSTLEKVDGIAGWQNVCNDLFELDGTDGRRIIGFVPRRTLTKPNKNLVNLSGLIVL